jgi:hypothetical protein
MIRAKHPQATLLELSFGMQARWLLRPIMGIWNKYVKSSKVRKTRWSVRARTRMCTRAHVHVHKHASRTCMCTYIVCVVQAISVQTHSRFFRAILSPKLTAPRMDHAFRSNAK